MLGAGTCFEHGKLIVGHVLVFNLFDLRMNCGPHLLRRMAGSRHGIEGEQVGIFLARESAEARGFGGDFLVAHQAAIENRGAAVRHDVADRVIHRIVLIQIIGPMIALDVERLRRFFQRDRLFRLLRRLDRRQSHRAWGRWGCCRNISPASAAPGSP